MKKLLIVFYMLLPMVLCGAKTWHGEYAYEDDCSLLTSDMTIADADDTESLYLTSNSWRSADEYERKKIEGKPRYIAKRCVGKYVCVLNFSTTESYYPSYAMQAQCWQAIKLKRADDNNKKYKWQRSKQFNLCNSSKYKKQGPDKKLAFISIEGTAYNVAYIPETGKLPLTAIVSNLADVEKGCIGFVCLDDSAPDENGSCAKPEEGESSEETTDTSTEESKPAEPPADEAQRATNREKIKALRNRLEALKQ